MTDKIYNNDEEIGGVPAENTSADIPMEDFVQAEDEDFSAKEPKSEAVAEPVPEEKTENDSEEIAEQKSEAEPAKADHVPEQPINNSGFTNNPPPPHGFDPYAQQMGYDPNYAGPAMNRPPMYGRQENPNFVNNGYGNPNPNMNNSGEYRYKPPYGAYGANAPRQGYGPVPGMPPQGTSVSPHNQPQPQPQVAKKTEKVVGRRFSTAALALTLVACILFAFGAGFGGAYLALSMGGYESEMPVDEPQNTDDNGNALVIYKSASIVDEDGNPITGALTVADVQTAVADAVVEITTEIQTSYGPYQYVSEGAGSGVVISADGYVITNNHVIADDSGGVADTIIVRLKDSTEYEAEVVGTDSESDVALLKIDAKGLAFAVAGDSDKLVVGENIVAIGNPLGELGGTVTSGIVSATGRTIDVDGTEMTLIQIDAAVNPGNSGGGLFNMKGELVGIVNAKSTGDGVEGLGFAIPVNDAVHVADQLMTNGYVTGRTYIGVSFADITDAFDAYRYFGSKNTGVYVYETLEGYNDKALKNGDRIVAVDGNEISSSDDIKSIVKSHAVGDVLTFTIYRDGTLTEVEVTCYEYIPS